LRGSHLGNTSLTNEIKYISYLGSFGIKII